jgi:uncharacterized Fe-S center protein
MGEADAMSKTARVTLASSRPRELRTEATLPCLLDRMLESWHLKKRFKGKSVAIKLHLGGGMGYSTIHPLLVGRVVKAVRDAGGKPFLTDSPGSVLSAKDRGYTAETVGAPLVAVTGPSDKHVYPRKVGFRTLKSVGIAGAIVEADAMLVLSHGKGHGQSGFGGAIKNIAMGCVDGPTRGQIHRLSSSMIRWDASKCTGCLLCRDNCPTGAITYEDKKIEIFDHNCKYCMHCHRACPKGAIRIDDSGVRHFQRGMALTVREALRTFEPGRVFYVTALLQVTPFCDCWGFTTPSIVPDIGIVASDDLVAVEQAALDLVKSEDFIEGSLPSPLKRTGGGHLFRQVHGKDPYLQVEECARLKLGARAYTLTEVK